MAESTTAKPKFDGNHIPTCWEGKAKACPSDKTLHSEKVGEHWWSGWPGAFCMKCGEEDATEGCMADCCACPCHDAMWDDYERACVTGGPWRSMG